MKKLQDGQKCGDIGICIHVWRDVAVDLTHLCRNMWTHWEHYSGHVQFPVPGINGSDPCDCYIEMEMNNELWVGSYGQKRNELLQFLITQFEQYFSGHNRVP